MITTQLWYRCSNRACICENLLKLKYLNATEHIHVFCLKMRVIKTRTTECVRC